MTRVYLAGNASIKAALESRLTNLVTKPEEAQWILDFYPDLASKKSLYTIYPEHKILSLVYPASATVLAALHPNPHLLVGFSAIAPVSERTVLELMPALQSMYTQEADEVLSSTGLEVVTVQETPAGVAARVVACLINEAFSALQEGVADGTTIDTAVKLGVNYPRGMFEWSKAIGLDTVLIMLEGLYQEFREDRYRPSPLLRRYALAKKDVV